MASNSLRVVKSEAGGAGVLATRFSALGWLLSLNGWRRLEGCAAIQRQEVDGRSQYEVAVTREVILPGTLETVFDFIVAEDVLPKVLTGYGPLPAVVGTTEVTGPWNVPGSQRLVHMADGGTVREQVTHWQRAQHFAYRLRDFSHPLLKRLVSGGRGEWFFETVPGGVRVVWTYTFVARNRIAAVPLATMAQLLWRGYMDVCLENSREHLWHV